MIMKFEVGDKVKAFGCDGEVVGVYDAQSVVYPLVVEFLGCKLTADFEANGRFGSWHKEPSLVLIEKARKYVEFNDWETGKYYKHQDKNKVYAKMDGLPFEQMNPCGFIPSKNSVEFFAINKFYEVRDEAK
jgi:hypothetical protein